MDAHLTAYPQLKKHYSKNELEQCFTPTFEEKLFIEKHTDQEAPENRIIFMLLLKCYQCLGRDASLEQIPDSVKEHVVQQMQQEKIKVPKGFPSSNKKRYLDYIRHFLGINIDQEARKKLIETTIETYAKIRNDVVDIVNTVLDVLIKGCFELPALSQLIRQTTSALHQANEWLYHSIDRQLTDQAHTAIQLLIKKTSVGETSEWFSIKQEIAQPSLKKTKQFIQQFQSLKHYQSLLPINLQDIPTEKINTFYHEAESIDSAVLKRMKPHKQHALVALYINHKLSLTLDDFCQVFTRWFNQIFSGAQELLNQYRIDHADEADKMIDTLHSMLKTLTSEEKSEDKIDQLMKDIPKDEDIDSMMEKCEKHALYEGNNFYPFTLKLYKNKRSGIFDLLEQLDLHSSYCDNSLLSAAKQVIAHRHYANATIPLTQEDYPLSLELLPDNLKKIAIDKEKQTIQRHYYELGIFANLVDELSCGDVFVKNAFEYNDPNAPLITWAEFEKYLKTYCDITELQKDKKSFIQSIQSLLTQQAEKTDQNFPNNPYLQITNNQPYLKKSKTEERSDRLNELSDVIDDRMKPVTIINVLHDVDQWVGLSQHLKTSAGYQARIEDISSRYAATLYAYGCNVGPVQAAFSLDEFSRKQVAALFNHHMTEPRIEGMSTRVVNYYSRFVLPKYWGDGSSLSVDGSYWEMYTSNLLAAHHIRYGKYGGLGYYHVSDQYIALYSNFLTCGVHEGSYLIDGVIENLSALQPHIVHGDTGSQSEVVFALCFLLGIKLMPRIKQLKHLKYYKAFCSNSYEHIDSIFSKNSINWDIIEKYYHDMLRVAISIQQGKIKASTVLRKFNSKNKKNKLYYAIRELGRVVRTIYLLHYMDDVETRKMVHAGTCKSEEFNNFLDWVSFGNNKVIRENRKNAQRKIIKCGHLVANMVMTHVVVNMTGAINQLRNEGYVIDESLLKNLSPYRTGHINRLGVFIVDKNRKAEEPVFELDKNRSINAH